MTKLAKPAATPPSPRVAGTVTIAAITAAMYRLQETGDPLVILWAAGAIILFTCAGVLAQAVERFLSRVFGTDEAHDDDQDGPSTGRARPRRRHRA
jgi:hypothetical protein